MRMTPCKYQIAKWSTLHARGFSCAGYTCFGQPSVVQPSWKKITIFWASCERKVHQKLLLCRLRPREFQLGPITWWRSGNKQRHLIFSATVDLSFSFDLHWRPYYLHCEMCTVHFDAIVHLENVANEAPFVIQRLAGIYIQKFLLLGTYIVKTRYHSCIWHSLGFVVFCWATPGLLFLCDLHHLGMFLRIASQTTLSFWIWQLVWKGTWPDASSKPLPGIVGIGSCRQRLDVFCLFQETKCCGMKPGNSFLLQILDLPPNNGMTGQTRPAFWLSSTRKWTKVFWTNFAESMPLTLKCLDMTNICRMKSNRISPQATTKMWWQQKGFTMHCVLLVYVLSVDQSIYMLGMHRHFYHKRKCTEMYSATWNAKDCFLLGF